MTSIKQNVFTRPFKQNSISFFRTRVHAQRKFAQGQGSSSYISNFPPQQSTPVKESSEPPPELLPNLRPKPEDFLTFLCFRGTSVLPPHLDYFNQNKKPETETKDGSGKDETVVNDAEASGNKDIDADASCSKPSGSGAGNSSESSHVKDSKVDSKEEVKPIPFIPFAVRKHAETVSDGKRRQTVQALKRKYQEQRLAKTQVQNLIKTTQNRRTRSSGKDDTVPIPVEKKKVTADHKADDAVVVTKKAVDDKKKKEVTEIKSDDSSKRKPSLRNTRNNPPKEDDAAKTDAPKTSAKKKAKISEDEEKVPAKLEKKMQPETTSTKETKKEPTKTTSQKQQITRQQAASVPQNVETKTKPLTTLTNDTAEFSDSSDDRPLVNALKKLPNVTKKSAESNPSKSQAQKPSDSEKKKDQLTVTTSTSKPLKRQSPRPTVGVSRRSCGPAEVTTDKKRADSLSRKSDTSEPSRKKKPVGRKKKQKEPSDDSSSEKETPTKKKLNEKRTQDKEKDDSKHKTNLIDDDSIQKKRKRRNEFTELGNVDINDSDACRSARPSRKTKEAAAIYMELIGQKLNLDDFDDDGFSMDSFPELPNVKKTQQMENKLKANIGKPTDVKVSPKKNKPENKSSKNDDKDESIVEEPVKVEKAKVGRKKKLLSPSKDTSPVVKEKSLQKSFSDSDDEPLAVKITKKPKLTKGKSPKKSKDSKEAEKVEEKKIQNEVKEKVKQETPTKEKTVGKVTTPVLLKATDSAKEKLSDSPKTDATAIKIPTPAPKTSQVSFESVFKTPAETSSQLLSPSICTTPAKPSQIDTKNITNTSSSPKSMTTTHETKSNLPNLMPSAEESGKIFGIASVTLAQSSGPNDTKCTLGKCGSVHTPTLGPVIPTEVPTTDPTTSKEKQRRAKVNMSRAQIQKWILECARAR